MSVEITPVPAKGTTAPGLSVGRKGGRIVFTVTRTGLVACGKVDRDAAERFGFAVPIARGTPERPLATPEDLLEAPIRHASEAGRKYGVTGGITGREALDILSD